MLEIHVTTYNRKTITKRCLELLKQYSEGNQIHIHDDSSTEYDLEWLEQFSDKVTQSSFTHRNLKNIDKIMLEKLVEFKNSDYTFLYSCDNDILHDPEFLNKAFELYEKYRMPVTLYRTHFHQCVPINLEVAVQKSFPGCSILFHRSHLDRFTDQQILDKSPRSWDWHIGDLLQSVGSYFVCPRTSYCDHYPEGGLHSIPSNIGENITEFLAKERSMMNGQILP